MASIHKDPRGKSPFWYCAYRLPSGKRGFKSTKQTNHQKAMVFCRTLEYASRESKAGRLTESRVQELISEIVLQTTGEPLRFYSAEGWLRDWLKGKEVAKSEGTTKKYKHTIESFLQSLGERAKRNINQISPRDIQRFRDAEIEAGKHPRTCNFAVKHLRMPFNVARRQGLITHNPAEAIEMLQTDNESTRHPFDLHQVSAILEEAAKIKVGKPTHTSRDWQGVIMVAFYTGGRLQDVTNLRWESIDLENKWIAFRAGKTRQRIKVPMHDSLHDFLLELPAPDNVKAFVFPALAGKRAGGKSGLSMAFKRIMERAKVRGEVARERTGKAGRTVNTLSFHSFRHTLTSIMANAGVPIEVRQKFTGHASADMNVRYTHHEVETLRSAVGKLPTLHV
ncbi:MAG: site-specific integrase [Chthoniobacterales bacterium]|nr:site-specific integrase [Chthoniobacterales bacterium]